MKTLKHNQQERLTQHNKHNDLSEVAENLPTGFYEEQYIADTGLVDDPSAELWMAIDEAPLDLLGGEFQEQFLSMPDSDVVEGYDQANTYALNADAMLATDAAEQALLADEVAVQSIDAVDSTPWKAIGAALAGTGVVGAAAAGGGGGSDSPSDPISETVADDTAAASLQAQTTTETAATTTVADHSEQQTTSASNTDAAEEAVQVAENVQNLKTEEVALQAVAAAEKSDLAEDEPVEKVHVVTETPQTVENNGTEAAAVSADDAVEQAQAATATQNETNTAGALATAATNSDTATTVNAGEPVASNEAVATTEQATSATDSSLGDISADKASEPVTAATETDDGATADQAAASNSNADEQTTVKQADNLNSSATDTVAADNTVEEAVSNSTDTSAATVSNTPATVTESNADVSALTNTGTTTFLNTQAQFIASNIPSGSSYVVVSSMTEAASAVSSNSALKYVVISDGDHFALFQKGNSSGDVTTTWGGSTWGATFKDYVPLSAFMGTSSKDITTSLQKALDVAAKLGLGVEMPNDGQYTLAGSIKIHGEVPFLHGNGSTVSVNSTGSLPYAFRLGGMVDTYKLEFSDLNIDMNGLSNKFAIWGKDVSGANLHHLNIIDASYTAISLKPTAVGLKNITIADSIIDLNWSSTSGSHYYGIGITNPMESSSYTGQYALWQQYLETGTVPKSLYDISGIKISGNQINGGYYGIYFSGVSNSEISDNLLTNNVRNIALQNNSNGNTVSGNYLTDQTSSAVHIAYNSNSNTIKNNTVATYTSNMQALIQAYQDSDNNAFIGNNLEVLGSVKPGWALYSGTDSSGTQIANNIASGTYRKTVIGAEAIWDNTSVNANGLQEAALMSTAVPGSSAGKSGVITYNGGMGSIDNISVTGNIVDPNFKLASVIYAGADVSTGYDGNQKIVGNVNGLNVANNVVFGTNGSDFKDVLRLHENGANITGVTNKNNSVLNGSNADNFSGTAAKTTFYVDSVNDKLTDASSTDNDMVYSSVSYTLPERVENLTLIGPNALNGTGNSGNNVIAGNGYANVLKGGDGDDTLIGALGHDTLTGGAGKDVFLFNSVLRSDSVDTITDFSIGTDKIGLSSVIFGDLEGNNWFASSSTAVNKDTKVYQSGASLYYDADGSGAYFSAVEFAKLNTSDKLSITSFEIL